MALGKANFGVSTFFAASHANDKCGANGLPLTPNSIKVIGKFQLLKKLDHPSICKYLDCVRGKHERLIIVQEHYTNNLSEGLKAGLYHNEPELLQISFEILEGLTYLNHNGITHRNMRLDNILLDTEGHVKLSMYGLYHMTDYGASVRFPIGLQKYTSPEVFCYGPVKVDEETESSTLPASSPKVDIWCLGCILLELLSGCQLWSNYNTRQIVRCIMGLLKTGVNSFDYLVTELKCQDKIEALSKPFVDFLQKCLSKDPRKRPNPLELLQHEVLSSIRANKVKVPQLNGYDLFTSKLRCKDLELPTLEQSMAEYTDDHLSERAMEEVYYLWRLAGGDLEAVLKKAGLIKVKPPVTILPMLTLENGEVSGQGRDQAELLDNTVVLLSQDQLRQAQI